MTAPLKYPPLFFIIANKLTENEVVEKAEELSFPNSVIEYFQGYLGIPPLGFPEPLRSRVLKGRTIEGTSGLTCFEGRPGKHLRRCRLISIFCGYTDVCFFILFKRRSTTTI